jgi:hypothetical protein
MALTYAQLGLLASARDRFEEALDYAVRAHVLFDALSDRRAGDVTRDLARLTGQMGEAALEQSWQRVTGQPLPDPVRAGVAAILRDQDGQAPGEGGAS